MRPIIFATAALALAATTALAAPEKYELDPSHSQVMFSYAHLGFSTTYNILPGWEGEVMFDAENPANSSVEVSVPLSALFTGWEARYAAFMSEEFFDAKDGDMITFTSTDIEVTGDKSAKITGDFSINGVTKSVTLDARLTKAGPNPIYDNRDWLGFDATTTLLRSDFGVGKYAPYVSDELKVNISIEAGKAE